MINITDWDKLYQYRHTDPIDLRNLWDGEIRAYNASHNGVDDSELVLYALLKVYGDAIVITKQDAGTDKTDPIEIDKYANVATKPCK